MRARPPRWKQAALLLASTGLALAAAEIWLRRSEEARGHWAVHDPTLGWDHKPGYSGRFRSPEFDTALRISSQGLRESETFPLAKHRFRIALVGDSFAWGHGVEEEERFGEGLEAALGPDYEVINFAVAGYGTDQQLLKIERDVLPFEPDLLLVAFYFNDLLEVQQDRNGFGMQKPLFSLGPGTSLELTHVPVPYRDLDAAIRLGASRELRVWTLARGLFERPRQEEHRFSEFPIQLLHTSHWREASLEAGLRLHARLYERLVELAASGGATLVLLEIPFKEYFIPDDVLESRFGLERSQVPFDRTRQQLTAWSAELGFAYLDPYAHLAAHGGHENYYAVDRHLTRRGHAVLADWLARALVPPEKEPS